MDNEQYISELKDLLIRIEGAKQLLDQGNAVFASRKLQGVKDTLAHRIKRLLDKSGAEAVAKSIKTAVNLDENYHL